MSSVLNPDAGMRSRYPACGGGDSAKAYLSTGKRLTCRTVGDLLVARQISEYREPCHPVIRAAAGREACRLDRLGVIARPHEDSRARVLQVALELFAEQGFAATSTRELSERLGFTKAALYYYFRTKSDLLPALVQPVLDDLTALVTHTCLRPSASARRDLLAAYIDISTHHLDLLRVLTQDPSIARRPASATHAALYARMLALLA